MIDAATYNLITCGILAAVLLFILFSIWRWEDMSWGEFVERVMKK